jgi:hypothetical protein
MEQLFGAAPAAASADAAPLRVGAPGELAVLQGPSHTLPSAAVLFATAVRSRLARSVSRGM